MSMWEKGNNGKYKILYYSITEFRPGSGVQIYSLVEQRETIEQALGLRKMEIVRGVYMDKKLGECVILPPGN